MRLKLLVAAGLALAAAVGPAAAHHSFAMFDYTKTVELDGTVRSFQFTNPHSWVQIVVTQDGGTKEWNIELGAVPTLYRGGVRRDTLKPGDKIKISIHPLRSGEPGGAGAALLEINGKPMPPGMLVPAQQH
jgi:Family of unknown function (DUF6152)